MVSEYVRTVYTICMAWNISERLFFVICMHGIRIRSYCIYHMHGVEYFRETIFCDLVKFRFAVVVIDATLLSQR